MDKVNSLQLKRFHALYSEYPHFPSSPGNPTSQLHIPIRNDDTL